MRLWQFLQRTNLVSSFITIHFLIKNTLYGTRKLLKKDKNVYSNLILSRSIRWNKVLEVTENIRKLLPHKLIFFASFPKYLPQEMPSEIVQPDKPPFQRGQHTFALNIHIRGNLVHQLLDIHINTENLLCPIPRNSSPKNYCSPSSKTFHIRSEILNIFHFIEDNINIVISFK